MYGSRLRPLAALQRGEAVVQIGGRDWNVLAQAQGVVVIDPGVVTRFGAGVLEAFEAWPRILVVGEAFGAMIASGISAVQRVLALAAIEADQGAVRA